MLNKAQREAVLSIEKPTLVLAGAGSGKTTVLIEKIKYLKEEIGVPPSRILALTFSNKAAKEMRERAYKKMDLDWKETMELSTFHSYCLKLLKKEAHRTAFAQPNFVIYEPDDVQKVIKQIVKANKWQYTRKNEPNYVNTKNVANYISYLKNEMVDGKTFDEEVQSSEFQDWKRILEFIEAFDYTLLEKIKMIYLEYEEKMKKMNAMDFDDLILKTALMLSKEETIRKKYSERYEYLLIDEFQDTNRVQYVITFMLAKDKRKITVVGDDYQSIYAFRGSDIRNILDFDKDFNDAEIIKLEQNYRSTKKIIEAANQIIQHNVNQRHKVLFTENPEGEKIKVYSGMNEYNEAAFVAQEIQSLKMQGIDYKDIAVLFRNNQKSAMIETLLNNEGVPNKVVSGMSFFQRREIKDVLYYLRFLLSTSDPLYLREVINIPKRGVGDASVDKMIVAADGKSFLDILNNPEGLKRVNEKAKDGIRDFNKIIKKSLLRLENDSVSNVVQNLLDELDLINKHYFNEEKAKRRERQDNLNQFIVLIKEKEKQNPNMTLSEFIEEMTLFPVEESDDSGYVQLMTMHASKGLEFKVVFLVGMDSETFPSKRANTEFELEEERRVAYVAFTRAKELLYLTFPEEIYVRGTSGFKEVKANQPSPYLKEFDRKLMSVITQRYI